MLPQEKIVVNIFLPKYENKIRHVSDYDISTEQFLCHYRREGRCKSPLKKIPDEIIRE
jgi:hypothetical protein